MNNCRVIDLNTWPRRTLFEFYRKFDSPSFTVSVELDAGYLFAEAKRRGESFFLMALYAILHAANAVPQMRQRIVDGQVVEFDRIAAMTPIMTEQELFRQIWCEDAPTYEEFKAAAAPKVEAAKQEDPAPLSDHGEDFFCASCVPWLHFTSVTQADLSFSQTVPILAWGKMENNLIPISCKFSHCFMDGLHVSRFFHGIEQHFAGRSAK